MFVRIWFIKPKLPLRAT